MSELKRDFVKYIRDKAKSAYSKGSSCEICGATEELDFHHFYSVAELVNRWLKTNKLKIESVDQAHEFRDRFISEHHAEIYEHAVTLCHTHHMKLHSIYGRNPQLITAKKQMNWVSKQREKHGMV